jgi:hypothetical protein
VLNQFCQMVPITDLWPYWAYSYQSFLGKRLATSVIRQSFRNLLLFWDMPHMYVFIIKAKILHDPTFFPGGFELLVVYIVFYSIFRFGRDMIVCLFVLNHRQSHSLRRISMFLSDILCALGVQGHIFLIMHLQLIYHL